MTKKRPQVKGKKLSTRQLQHEVAKLFKRQPKKRLNAKQVIKKLKIFNSKDAVAAALEKLAENNIVRSIGDHKYVLNKAKERTLKNESTGDDLFEGIVDMTRTGAAYIICEGKEDDIFVASKHLNSAMNGDKVKISIYQPRGRRRPEGKVKKVLERASDQFTGSIRITKKYGIVSSDKNPSLEIYVALEDLKGAKEGEKVVVKITKWPKRSKQQPIGVVTIVLGTEGSSDIEMKTILINNGFELEFPENVMRQANRLNNKLSEAEIASRRDMRDITTFTIDPETAKDFDDALSIRHLENGDCEVGVHIADVTHYVKPNTALDKEALKRSTSVYLVDRVLPMLPEKLSNELCSLRPNEDKCTFSAVFTFDKEDKLIGRWFGKTLTHSDRRFTYEDAQERLEKGKGDYAKELKILNRIALKLREEKFKNGAISFESEEVKFRLDESGKPIDIYVKERKAAHMLIEDFMLLANKEVSIFVAKKSDGKEIPYIYRVHDEPNPDKLVEFSRFAKELGVNMNVSTPQHIVASFNNLAKLAREDERLRMLEPIAIRTMAKAEYSPNNIGHYGLGFDYYTHFTSPIRRYSDVIAHRILELNLDGEYRMRMERLEAQCKHISVMERKAMDAERESIKYKQVEYIKEQVGKVFEGRISGIIERGIFVELVDSKCEGMVAFETLGEGFVVEDSRLKATGRKSRRVLKMGDTINVLILEANLERRQIEMELVED